MFALTEEVIVEERIWRRGTGISVLLLIILVAVGLLVGAGGGDNASGTTPKFGTPAQPFGGAQANTNPVFETVQNWRDLVNTVDHQHADWYKDCLQSRIGVTWDQAQAYAKLVDQGNDLRFILVSNSSVTDDQARQILKDAGIKAVDNLPIKRVSGFENTQGLPQDKCQAFGDSRSQVRVSLAIPIDVKDLKKGIHDDKGVLGMCSNPWKLLPPGSTTPTTKPSPSTTTTTLTPKDQSKNIDRNPNVPPAVTKTGPSPDNQQQINQGPKAPVDSSTGCNGTCPTSSTTTQTTKPASTTPVVTDPPANGNPGAPSSA